MSREAGHYLKTVADRGTAGVSTATLIVAAHDSLHPERADYVCDGTDDQGEINSAILKGDTYLMKGTFHISEPIQMKESFSNLSGAGHGWDLGGTMIYLDDGSDCNMVELLGTEHRVYFPTIHDLILEGNKDNNASGHGIYCPITTVNEVSDQMFYNLGIHNIKENGMQILGGWYVSVINIWCEVCGGVGAKLNVQSNVLNSVFSSNLGNGLELGGLCNILNSSIEQNVGHGLIFNASYSSIGHSLIRENSKDSAGSNHGIVIWSADDITIANNIILGSAKQGHGIYSGAGTERINIHDNNISGNVTSPITANGTGHKVYHNIGFMTENSGTATLANGTTSIVVTHGLAVTPAAGDIVVTPIEAWGNMTQFYIDTYTSTQFTIHADINPGQDVDFAWKAIVL